MAVPPPPSSPGQSSVPTVGSSFVLTATFGFEWNAGKTPISKMDVLDKTQVGRNLTNTIEKYIPGGLGKTLLDIEVGDVVKGVTNTNPPKAFVGSF